MQSLFSNLESNSKHPAYGVFFHELQVLHGPCKRPRGPTPRVQHRSTSAASSKDRATVLSAFQGSVMELCKSGPGPSVAATGWNRSNGGRWPGQGPPSILVVGGMDRVTCPRVYRPSLRRPRNPGPTDRLHSGVLAEFHDLRVHCSLCTLESWSLEDWPTPRPKCSGRFFFFRVP